MRKFAVSDKHTGPWLGDCSAPDQALAKGRAMWGANAPLYVALIEPMNPAEGLPSIEQLLGDVRETLVDKYGSGADAAFDELPVQAALAKWWKNIVNNQFAQMFEGEERAVPTLVKLYSADNNVKVSDFK
jgi:hypothetical protein